MKPRLKFVGYTTRVDPSTYQPVTFSVYTDGVNRWLIGGGHAQRIGYELSFLQRKN